MDGGMADVEIWKREPSKKINERSGGKGDEIEERLKESKICEI